MRSIQRKDLLILTDLSTEQLWVVSELVDDINATIERGYLEPVEIAEVLERLAAILRRNGERS
jgi:hypothetical protein